MSGKKAKASYEISEQAKQFTVPYGINIEKETLKNTDFRHVLHTSPYMQLVLMSIKPGQDIGMEVHPYTTQFFRAESGHGIAVINNKSYPLNNGDVVIVPPGNVHNIINLSKTEPLQLYTIYAPPHHPPKTTQKNKPSQSIQSGGNLQISKNNEKIATNKKTTKKGAMESLDLPVKGVWTIYGRSSCPYTNAAVKYMEKLGEKYVFYDTDAMGIPSTQSINVLRSTLGSLVKNQQTVPMIFNKNLLFIGGFSDLQSKLRC